MTRLLFATTLAVVLFEPALGTSGRTSDSPLQLAHLAWERGDYAAALSAYLQLLESPDAGAVLEPIALQTGELYRTVEVTPEGAFPQFAPDGSHFLYESGTGVGRVTRVIATSDPTRVAIELRGWGAAFSPDGSKIAYVKLLDSAEVAAARAAVEAAAPAERAQRTNALADVLASSKGSQIMVRDLAAGHEAALDAGTVTRTSVLIGAGNAVIFSGTPSGSETSQIHAVGEGRPLTALTTDQGDKVITGINSTGTALTFTLRPPGGGRGGRGGGGGGGGTPAAPARFGVLSIPEGRTVMLSGSSPSFSADGRTLVFVSRSAVESSLMMAAAADPSAAIAIRKGPERVDFPAASADGTRIAFQMMTRDDWEIFHVNRDGSSETRLTRDIQHDLLPQFLGADRLLAVTGEPRHRRSFLYDLESGKGARLFHNNTVRTIAPEYSWEPSADGSKVLVVADRDGNTISTERGIYLMDLTRKVTREELLARLRENLAHEEALRAKAKRLYATMTEPVKAAVAEASVARVYGYEKALFDFDSKHITRPGNKLAAEYLFETYKSFGYAPEMQWFERTTALGGRTANVLATLKGTVNPELIYVVSSHYDSVAAGPGADDDSSGTAALLETARILARRPQPATIVFASFTGEEAGLLGSREFVRRAVADKLQILGALNNDMVGWANDHRLDNTIRYSNPGIRDIQHAAAMLFTNLITYDALYYRGTDAAAYYEAFGDIVGGIGSYPVLSSPHYHQSHDVLSNMNHQLITEVAKTTVATLMLLTSSPSRLTNLKVDRFSGTTATLSWTPSPETGVTGYIVAYGPSSKPEAQQMRVAKPTATLTNVAAGTVVAVKAVNGKGLEGWDWARMTVQ
jgi:Tol biopolymer transport system component